MFASLVLYSLMFVLVLFSLRKSKKNWLERLGFKKIKLGEEVLVGIFYLGTLILVAFLIGIIFFYAGFEQDLAKVPAIIEQIQLSEILVIVLVGSIVEEIFFRGYLQRKTNLLFASFMFSYFHIIYGSISEMVGAFFLGMILGIAFEKRKNLFVPVFAHVFYNIITIMLLFVVA